MPEKASVSAPFGCDICGESDRFLSEFYSVESWDPLCLLRRSVGGSDKFKTIDFA
ncbi:MAG: hypothetical protein GF353_17540 [Candidatus Lokiarchaeota archaeon]|nr:hypothetical protein [Candidatus Lokiarchaeota archaeon]